MACVTERANEEEHWKEALSRLWLIETEERSTLEPRRPIAATQSGSIDASPSNASWIGPLGPVGGADWGCGGPGLPFPSKEEE